MLRYRNSQDLLVPFLLVGGWCAIALWLATGFREIRLSDVQPFIARAVALDLTDRKALVDGYYPWGYPYLLRLVAGVTGDYQRAAQALSLVGGALTLSAVWITARQAFGVAAAVAATTLLATNHEFNVWAISGSTDSPVLGSMYAAVAALVLYARVPWVGWAIAAGGFLGIGYLVRYTILTTVPVALAFIAALPGRPLRTRTLHVAACVAGFLIASAPQLIPTALQTGNPFWNRQDHNVYFGMFGGMNWGRGWQEATEQSTGVLELLGDHPQVFVWTLGKNLVELAEVMAFFPAVLAVPGALALLSRRRDWWTGGLVLASALSYAVAVSMTFITPRLALPVFPAVMILAGYALARIPPATISVRGIRLAVAAAVVAAAIAWSAARNARSLERWLRPTELTRVSNALHQDGMTSASEVLSLDFQYYDLGSPHAELFARSWFTPMEDVRLDSVTDVVRLMRQDERRYLVFNDSIGVNIASLDGKWPTRDVPGEFVELYRDASAPHARVWRLNPPEP